MSLAFALTVAIVVGDKAAMRAAPEPDAPRQAVLYKGNWLETRGERKDYLQVYDHGRERPGYVHRSLVHTYELNETVAQELKTIIAFLKDTPGAESLGIGYVALYLRAAPVAGLDSQVFDALGTMAERLGRRASVEDGSTPSNVGAHLDVAASYGVHFLHLEHEGRTRVCYDGEAFRRVLSIKASAAERARAALALTNPACVKRELAAREKQSLYRGFLSVLEQADLAAVQPFVANRLHIRRAIVGSLLAFEHARQKELAAAEKASHAALQAYLRIDQRNLTAADGSGYARAALHVAAARWTREAPRKLPQTGLTLQFAARQPGETCLKLIDGAAKPKPQEFGERCTYGLPWPTSVQIAPDRKQLTVAVQHLPGWIEVWRFRPSSQGMNVDILVPAMTDPQLGYVEIAGWTPQSGELLVVREAFVDGKHKRLFQSLRADNLSVKTEASSLARFRTFRRWSSPEWKSATLALR